MVRKIHESPARKQMRAAEWQDVISQVRGRRLARIGQGNTAEALAEVARGKKAAADYYEARFKRVCEVLAKLKARKPSSKLIPALEKERDLLEKLERRAEEL